MCRSPASRLLVGSKPTQPSSGQQRLDPRVRRAVGRSHVVVRLMEQIAADVAAGDAEPADQRDHDVREVLAHAAPRLQRVVDRRVDARALRAVLEAVEASRRSAAAASTSGSSPRSRPISRGERVERGGRPRERARVQQLPELARRRRSRRVAPRRRRRARRAAPARRCTRPAPRRSTRQPRMPAGNVEVMDDVAVVVLIHHRRATTGVVLSPKCRQRCGPSLRGCMRASITLSLIGAS